jgi:hypothetical protein
MDDAVWDVTVFTKNRERLIAGAISQKLLESVMVEARAHELLSEEHFTVDGTLIQAWASARSFHEKSDPPGSGSGSKGALLLRDKVESTTDPEARLYKKSKADKSVPAYMGHALIENRNGLAVAAEATEAGNAAERASALAMLDRTVGGRSRNAMRHWRSRWAPTRCIRKRSSSRLCGSGPWRLTSANTRKRAATWAKTV